LFKSHGRGIRDVGDSAADLLDVAEYAHADCGQQFLGDRCCRNAAQRLARARPPAAAVVAETILGVEREVRVARPVLVLDLRVILAALVLVAEEDADGRAIGLALKHAGPDLRHIFFLSLRHQLGLAWPASAKVRAKIIHGERQSRRAAIDDAQVTRPMADASRGHAEQFTKGVAGHF
jgi:hypothetical protein